MMPTFSPGRVREIPFFWIAVNLIPQRDSIPEPGIRPLDFSVFMERAAIFHHHCPVSFVNIVNGKSELREDLLLKAHIKNIGVWAVKAGVEGNRFRSS